MADLGKMKVNSKSIQVGRWIGKDHGTPIPIMGCEDLNLKVRGLSSTAYRDAIADKQTVLLPTDRTERGNVKAEISDRMYWECLDETILLDWSNLTSGGKELKHDAKTQTALILDEDNVLLRRAVEWAAAKVSDLAAQNEAKVEGN